MTIRSKVLAVAASAVLALGLGLGAAVPGSAATNAFIATPNGMVGMQQEIVFRAPSLAGQVATIGFVSGAISNAGQTAVNAQGYGSLAWTPTSAGSWTVSGLGSAATIGSTTINVAPMPTTTAGLVPNLVQTGVTNNITVVVSALDGIVAPSGSVVLRNQNQNVIGTGTLSPSGGAIATANVQWNPTPGETVTPSFVPSSTAFLASNGDTAQPQTTSNVVTIALRFPPVLYVGTPTVLGAQTGTGVPGGSASFLFDGIGIIGSTPTNSTGGVAAPWTPTASGVHTISTQFSSSDGRFSGTSSQAVNIQPAKPNDVITVTPQGGAAWNPGLPISVQAGSNTVLSASAQSGATVVLEETGPCVINGATMTALAAGQCVLTATSPGSASITGDTATYTITVTAPPKKPKRPRR
jgi:hypothetical protein